MPAPLRIVVADDERDTREFLQEALTRLGHQVVSAGDGRQLAELSRAHRPDLIITDIKMPGGVDGIEAALEIYREREVPVILVSAYHDTELLARAGADPFMAYLIKPVSQANLEAAIALALQRFERYRAVRQEAANLRQALEDRKLVERAKGVVMRRLGAEEGKAFQRMRKLASDQNRKLADLSRAILGADEIFQALEST